MSLRILIIQQLEHEPAALIEEVMHEHGYGVDIVMAQDSPVPDDLDGYDGLVVMGGHMSAKDERLDYIAAELELLQQAIKRDFPVLGICLGAQLLARAAGADILPSPLRELGWYPLYPSPEAAGDPLFSTLAEEGLHVFQWHGETFSLPAGARLLATHPNVPHQAFRLGNSQYGLQFHIEVDEAIIRSWVELCPSERGHLGDKGVEKMLAQCPAYLPAMRKFCRRMTSAWLDLMTRQPGDG
ncbi:MAG: type 1 glutamine amidotransferase [Mariprofundaceae bacterium]